MPIAASGGTVSKASSDTFDQGFHHVRLCIVFAHRRMAYRRSSDPVNGPSILNFD